MQNQDPADISAPQPLPGFWLELLRTLAYAVVLAITFRSIALEPFHIPSGSMKSTLLVGDYLFVSKFSYGYSRYSLPMGVKLFDGRILASEPKRGDIIVFRPPSNTRRDFIKRLIGLPGDHILIKNGIVFLNGKEIPRRRIDDFVDEVAPNQFVSIPRYVETLPEGKEYTVLDEYENSEADNKGEYIVPPGHYFFMGDNRDNSRDSRFPDEVGFVPFENLVGRADFLLFSSDGSVGLSEFWKWPQSLREGRFFRWLN